jgi:hypothetical protein
MGLQVVVLSVISDECILGLLELALQLHTLHLIFLQ